VNGNGSFRSPSELLLFINNSFNEEELKTLAFELGVDYDSLSGEGKSGKARELVGYVERRAQLPALVAAVRQARPFVDTTYSPERVLQLQSEILAEAGDTVREAFVELTHQVEAYLNQFDVLHAQLEEWKEVHSLMQDLQNHFAPVRSYIYVSGGQSSGQTMPQKEQERVLYEVEANWRPSRRVRRQLEELAKDIVAIGEPYDGSNKGPDWLLEVKSEADRLDKALFEDNVPLVLEKISILGDLIDQHLYLADKSLRQVATAISRIPRPNVYR
jgi:hypothetical protein